MKIKANINKWSLLKFQSFCIAKESINKMKRQHRDLDKIFVNNETDKRLVYKIYKPAHGAQQHQDKQPNQQMGDLNRHFSKDIQMAKRCMKRCKTLLIVREMQIKTTMRYHLTPVRMAIIKNPQTMLERVWREGNPPTLWECKLIQPLWRTVWRFLKNRATIWSCNLTPGHNSEKL